jgi:peptidylprolyl isomerase
MLAYPKWKLFPSRIYHLAVFNQVRNLQESLENIKHDLGTKRKAAALDGVKKSKTFLSGKTADKMLVSCRDAKICSDILSQMDAALEPLQTQIQASQAAFTGSEQEREALDKAYVQQVKLAKLLTTLEEQMIPENYETPVPPEYSDLPQLKKRATVEMKVKKANSGENFDINGVNFAEAKMVMVIDGYTGTFQFPPRNYGVRVRFVSSSMCQTYATAF